MNTEEGRMSTKKTKTMVVDVTRLGHAMTEVEWETALSRARKGGATQVQARRGQTVLETRQVDEIDIDGPNHGGWGR
jgi:hypothetical protein